MNKLLWFLKNNKGETENTGEVVFTAENPPKSKEDWTKLREKDPILFADLTQQNMDRTFRENKELKEKNAQIETQRNNLTVELDRYKQKVDTIIIDDNGKKTYDFNHLPSTKQEWEELMIDDPVLGTDLRNHYNNQTTHSQQKFVEAQASSRRIVQAEHPDMYLAELDDAGQPKKDDKGNIVLQVDTVSGEPIFDSSSEKGRLWEQIYNDNPGIASSPHAPELLMSAMERKLRSKGQTMVNDANKTREQQIAEGQVLQDGVVKPKPNVVVTFKSEEEKTHANGMVSRGLYKNLEEYVQHRDAKQTGYYDENRTPTFKKT